MSKPKAVPKLAKQTPSLAIVGFLLMPKVLAIKKAYQNDRLFLNLISLLDIVFFQFPVQSRNTDFQQACRFGLIAFRVVQHFLDVKFLDAPH